MNVPKWAPIVVSDAITPIARAEKSKHPLQPLQSSKGAILNFFLSFPLALESDTRLIAPVLRHVDSTALHHSLVDSFPSEHSDIRTLGPTTISQSSSAPSEYVAVAQIVQYIAYQEQTNPRSRSPDIDATVNQSGNQTIAAAAAVKLEPTDAVDLTCGWDPDKRDAPGLAEKQVRSDATLIRGPDPRDISSSRTLVNLTPHRAATGAIQSMVTDSSLLPRTRSLLNSTSLQPQFTVSNQGNALADMRVKDEDMFSHYVPKRACADSV